MKTKMLSMALMLGYALVGYGQKPNGNTDLPTIVPASPTAFELTKYGDIPVNESTGIASVSIPFLSIHWEKFLWMLE